MSEPVYLQTVFLVLGTVLVLSGLKFLRRYMEIRHEKRVPVAMSGIEARLDRIEAAVESTAIEVERISEANRFMAKLQAERLGVVSLPSQPERVITPH